MPIEQPEPLARPTLAQVLDAHIQAVLEDVHTTSWGTVSSFNASTQLATIQLCPRRSYVDDDGNRQTEQPAALVNVPIVFPGSGGSGLTFPIANGAQVLVLFAEGPIGSWFQGGQSDFDSGDDRRYHLSDAVALPGLRSSGNAISPAPPQQATVLTDPNQVRLGDQSASSAVVIQAGLDYFATALLTAIQSLGTAVAASQLIALASALGIVGTPGGSPPIPGPPLVTNGWTAGTTKVKAN